MRFPVTLSAAAILVVGNFAAAQETIDNPEFVQWSKFKKGASATYRTATNVGTIVAEGITTITLIEVAANKLVLETTASTKANGKEEKIPPSKRDVPNKLPKPKKAADTKPPGTYEEGTETLKVGGADIKTKWVKSKTEKDGSTTHGQTWSSDDVPGGLVKIVTGPPANSNLKTRWIWWS